MDGEGSDKEWEVIYYIYVYLNIGTLASFISQAKGLACALLLYP